MLHKINLIATYRCDLHCRHCSQGFPHQQADFPLALLPKLLAEAMPFGVKHIGLTGGEAHLHPEFSQIVETIVQYGYAWGFVSHGQRTEPYLPLMEKFRASFTAVNISFDGATAEVHDENRGRKGAFEKAVASAKLYVERGFRLKLKSSLNQKNKGQVEALVQLAADLGADGIIFGGTMPAAWNQPLVLSDAESLALYQRVMELKEKAPIEILTTSSLYTAGGVNFCGLLNLGTLNVSPHGNLDFCCDVQQANGVVGSLAEFSLAQLIQRWLEKSAHLQMKRAEQIAAGAMHEGFDTCAYCDKYLS